jgi:hypothetical protein
MTINWKEHGGPDVTAPPDGDGFSTRLIRQTVEARFSGKISYNWSADWLIITLSVSVKQLST